MFPLSLAPFEEYMLIDDRPTHPMCFFLKLTLSGPCDPAVLDEALRKAWQRHPLLAARVEERQKDRFFWCGEGPQLDGVRWIPGDRQITATHIDLFSEPGLRVSAQRSGTLTDLVFQFHHSSCDAVGALRFIEDLLVIYAALVDTDAQPAGVRSIDERRLPERGQFGLTRRKLLGMLHKQSVGLLGARQFLMRTPVPVQPIAIESAGAALPSDFPAAQAHIFSEMETAALLAAARDAGTTVNNLLVRDLFLALGDFRLRRQLSDDHQWLRLSIPVNLRSQDDERLSAANVVSMIFLDRRPFEFGNELALLKGIDHEMRRIKKNQLGLTFPLSLRFTRSLPGSISRMRRMSKKEICRGTAVLSNLVRPFIDAPLHRCDGKINAGGMILERIEFLPPVRPYTLAAFGALTYADRLHLALHFDQRGLATTEATELLKDFIGHISATARRDH